MRRFIAATLLGTSLMAASASVALAHGGGHAGGCEDFGHINRLIAQSPGDYGFPWAGNLGDIVSWFARLDDGARGVGDIVENVDHLGCG